MENVDWLALVTIRLAIEEDLTALEWEGEYVHFRKLYRQVYESVSRDNALIWIAELDPAGLVGQLFVQLISGRRELADGLRRAYIYGFRVKPAYRDSGLGWRLLEHVENDLTRRGFQWVTLNVGQDNPDAQRFYRRHGYHVVSAEPGRWSYIDHLGVLRDVHEPAWRMEKKIS